MTIVAPSLLCLHQLLLAKRLANRRRGNDPRLRGHLRSACRGPDGHLLAGRARSQDCWRLPGPPGNPMLNFFGMAHSCGGIASWPHRRIECLLPVREACKPFPALLSPSRTTGTQAGRASPILPPWKHTPLALFLASVLRAEMRLLLHRGVLATGTSHVCRHPSQGVPPALCPHWRNCLFRACCRFEVENGDRPPLA